MCFHLTVPHSCGCQLSEPLRDTVRINGINPIGSALEKVLTHRRGFMCIRETRYPQTKGSQHHRWWHQPRGQWLDAEAQTLLKKYRLLKIWVSFEIWIWWIWLLSKSCKLPSEGGLWPGHPVQGAGERTRPCLVMGSQTGRQILKPTLQLTFPQRPF